VFVILSLWIIDCFVLVLYSKFAAITFVYIQGSTCRISCDIISYHWLIYCRDIVAKLSNDEALHYGRKVRLIVRRLRAEIIDVNEEMKALNRWTIDTISRIIVEDAGFHL